ncbi:MAG TPA: DNA repair protein RecO [Amaricoccus sp.]|uniref:DNA repair protein RecO n=1 Tax=Amaricoccus sp. TaxID=1872485 RepID=UPI002BCB2FA3|nr:DNA repair protein RecO [Amaricoccus sp.]HMQ93091.1 DNA repair protein RecO [Amaricoccus sp.]HMR54226.1 DNA repair protein RecO [Amaricoccus sp.]HMR60080.1 DNA repair protein RecO [Amaricoccus sp.]HMU01230.1 DNA repair protein RecO [Amaricoccus sp.]
MDWRDEGILLTSRRHGESAAIVEIFTAAHGRHAGVVRGGAGRRMAPVLQPGALLAVEWSARLEEHIGAFRVDPVATRAAVLMGDRAALAALGAMTSLITAAMPERDPHPELYARSRELLAALGSAPDWPARYAAWELALLAELGFGLDLGTCAATGVRDGLVWVSPKSGRAISRAAGAPWADRLLPLPAFLRDGWETPPEREAIAAALALTGYFLEARLAPGLPREALPAARARAVEAMLRG